MSIVASALDEYVYNCVDGAWMCLYVRRRWMARCILRWRWMTMSIAASVLDDGVYKSVGGGWLCL